MRFDHSCCIFVYHFLFGFFVRFACPLNLFSASLCHPIGTALRLTHTAAAHPAHKSKKKTFAVFVVFFSSLLLFGWIFILFFHIHFCVSYGVLFLRLLPFFVSSAYFWHSSFHLNMKYDTFLEKLLFNCLLLWFNWLYITGTSVNLSRTVVGVVILFFPRWELFVAFLFIYIFFLLHTRCVPQFVFIVPI